jgi:TPR repeat protein
MTTNTSLMIRRRGLFTAATPYPTLPAHALRLYRSEVFFRSLIDIAVIGFLVVAAKTDFSNLNRWLLDWPIVTGMTSGLNIGTETKSYTQLTGPGSEIISTLIDTPRIEPDVIKQSGEPLAASLTAVLEALAQNKVLQALQMVSVLDEHNETVAYCKAIVLLRQVGTDRSEEARRLLKRAAEKAVYPAYLAMGSLLIKQVFFNEAGLKSNAQLIMIDDVGQVHAATREQLLAEAALYWERAAAFGRVDGFRLAGLARARGFGGNADFVGASTLWKTASEMGDSLSQHELGKMLLTGAGVQANAEEAIRLFRLSSPYVPSSLISLAAALVPKSLRGDIDAAREAITSLEKFERSAWDFVYVDPETLKSVALNDTSAISLSHLLHAHYLLKVAPQSLREPRAAMLHYETAAKYGSAEAAYAAGDALHTGLAGKRDPACAYGFYLKSRPAGPAKVDPILAKLAEEISDAGVRRGKAIAFELRTSRRDGGLKPVVAPIVELGVNPYRSVCELVPSEINQSQSDGARLELDRLTKP